MYILGKGKKTFLEFLRNLTPQILLLTISMVIGIRLDFTEFDFSNTKTTAAFYLVISVFLMAFLANCVLLMESCLESLDWFPRFEKAVKKINISGFNWVGVVCQRMWKRQKAFAIELVVTILVMQVGTLAVFFYAIKNSATLITQLGL